MSLVSVIMPCYNHGRFLGDSVHAILAQSHTNLELIIVDDYSHDDSWNEILRLAKLDSRIKPIRHERNLGASKSRNDGLQRAQGVFIGFCDADDIWTFDKLRIQIQLLKDNPDYGVTYCDAVILDEDGQPTGKRFSDHFPVPPSTSGWLFRRLIRENFINIQSVLMRKECAERVGSFDNGIKWVEDWWYWIRLSRDFRFLYSRLPLAKYRVHSRSTNVVQKRGYCMNRFKVYRRVLRTFPDLSRPNRAEIIFNMGANLCDLGNLRAGRRLLWNAVNLSATDLRAFGSFCRAIRRLMLPCQIATRNAIHSVLEPSEGPAS